MRKFRAYFILLAALLTAACDGLDRPYEGTYDQVLIYCGLGYNNLSGNLERNLEELQTDLLPGLSYDKAIVAFCHNTVGGSYTRPNPPVLIRLFRGPDGKPVRDTLKVYEDITVSASKEVLHNVLDEIRNIFPARRYGLLVSSHGTGWVPGGYKSDSEQSILRAVIRQPESPWPETKAITNTFVGSSSNAHWIDLQDFTDAIPMKMEYIILDNCLSGCVEVAWALRDKCKRLIITPTEVLTSGMIYNHLSRLMFSGDEPDLENYCREYYELYNSKSGNLRSGTITLVDCAKLGELAEAFGAIVSAHRSALDIYLTNTVQRYFYSSSELRFYFDLRDLADQLGATSAELARLDAALKDCVLYHAETPFFFDLALERCCGLSVYIPDPFRPSLNAAYKSLGWNQQVHLVE